MRVFFKESNQIISDPNLRGQCDSGREAVRNSGPSLSFCSIGEFITFLFFVNFIQLDDVGKGNSTGQSDQTEGGVS